MTDSLFPIHHRTALRLLRVATVTLFVGRAWQHLRWDAPYRELLWDSEIMAPLLSRLGWEWDQWVTSAWVDHQIALSIRAIGLFYLLAAGAAGWLSAERRWPTWILGLGSASLLVLAALYTKEKFMHLGQFFEYSIQVMTPVFLVVWVRAGSLDVRWQYAMRVAIALTFICHGLYAYGYYPRPYGFTMMTMAGLQVEEATAIAVLQVAGILDFVAGALLLVPVRRVWRTALIYCVVWGFLTSMARIWSYLWLVDLATVAQQWVHESLYRWCHFLLPLALWWYSQERPRNWPADSEPRPSVLR